MFVIDAPNSTEIEGKTFFTGRAGQLFDAMLLALGLSREQVYCSSVFKCAPTDDLSITSQCDAMVLRQIELVAPNNSVFEHKLPLCRPIALKRCWIIQH